MVRRQLAYAIALPRQTINLFVRSNAKQYSLCTIDLKSHLMRMVAGRVDDMDGRPVSTKRMVPQCLWNWTVEQLFERLLYGIFELVVQPLELALEAFGAPERCYTQGLGLQHVFDECVGAFEGLSHHR